MCGILCSGIQGTARLLLAILKAILNQVYLSVRACVYDSVNDVVMHTSNACIVQCLQRLLVSCESKR